MMMKAEVIWTGEGAVVAVSQRSRHSTDAHNDHEYKNDEGRRWQQLGASLIPLKCSSNNFNNRYLSKEKSLFETTFMWDMRNGNA